MNRMICIGVIAGLSVFSTACEREEHTVSPASPTSPAAAKDDHDHDDHAPTDGHSGPKHDLGTAKIGDFNVAVTQVGHVKAGEGATFEIRPTGTGEIAAVRAWVGIESGQGSVKVKAPKRGDFYDADLEVPATLPSGSKAWVEIETATSKSASGFELKR